MRIAPCAVSILLACSHPTPTAQPSAGSGSAHPEPAASKVVFQPLRPTSLPMTEEATACAPPRCLVIRAAADAPPPLREVAAAVDFTRFLLVAYPSRARFEEPVVTYDGTLVAGIVELPAAECPYCGGAAPPESRPIHVVVRVPRADGDIRVRTQPQTCGRCDPRLP